jgi:hypothetical protein
MGSHAEQGGMNARWTWDELQQNSDATRHINNDEVLYKVTCSIVK